MRVQQVMDYPKRACGANKRSGASAAELAIILPVLLLIVFACIDFGRAFYHSIAIDNAARAAPDMR